METQRNYRVTGLSEAGTVLTVRTDVPGAEPGDSGQSASEFAGPELEDEETWGFFSEAERKVLRRGQKQDEKRSRRFRREPGDVEAEPGPASPAKPQASTVATSAPLTCRMCKVERPAEDFSLMRTSKTGRRSYCRACAKSYADAKKLQS